MSKSLSHIFDHVWFWRKFVGDRKGQPAAAVALWAVVLALLGLAGAMFLYMGWRAYS